MDMDSFWYLEDEAIADVAFEAYGSNLEAIFYQAGIATANLLTDLNVLTGTELRTLKLSKSSEERLLKNYLDEIVYLKDADLFFIKTIEVSISSDTNIWNLTAKFHGDIFDFEKMPMYNDLKAITWHDFSLRQLDDETWKCYVLIDI